MSFRHQTVIGSGVGASTTRPHPWPYDDRVVSTQCERYAPASLASIPQGRVGVVRLGRSVWAGGGIGPDVSGRKARRAGAEIGPGRGIGKGQTGGQRLRKTPRSECSRRGGGSRRESPQGAVYDGEGH